MTDTRWITDRTPDSVLLLSGEEMKIVNDRGNGIGGFNIAGYSPLPTGTGFIILAGVPDDGHRVFIDVNYHATFQFQVKNTGDHGRRFDGYFANGDETSFYGPYGENEGAECISSSQSVILVWETNARPDLDVRVTVRIKPIAEEHAIVISYIAVPIAEAREAERLANRNFIQKWLDSRK